jgi:hypothetical protein
MPYPVHLTYQLISVGGKQLTFVGFMHELEELVDDRLEELPMRFEESWVLADNVHDIGSADCLVVFSSLHLGKAEQILDDSHQESLFGLLVCGVSCCRRNRGPEAYSWLQR